MKGIQQRPRRVLVVANETVSGRILNTVIRARVGDARHVLVTAPALNSRLRHWMCDDAVARAEAEARLRECLQALARFGVTAKGVVGDADPLQAISDALQSFDADELVIATHPEERSHWLARRVVDRARKRFDLPVVHVVVDGQNVTDSISETLLSAAA